jgi:predicted kinase
MKIQVLRGISGSGKTTFARSQLDALPADKRGVICSADRYFIDKDGHYKFNYRKLDHAHAHCFAQYLTALQAREDLVIVDNTNTRLYEISPYMLAAKVYMLKGDLLEVVKFSCSVSIAAERNVHLVPRGSIENMKKRFENLPSFWPEEELIYTNNV